MWECKSFDEAGDALHTRSVISTGERNDCLFFIIFLLHFFIAEILVGVFLMQNA